MKYDLEKFREALAVVISMGEPEEPPEDCSDDADEAYGKVLDEWQAFALGLDDATMHLIGDFHYDADTGAIAALKSIALLRFGEAVDCEEPQKALIGGDICANRGSGFCRVSGYWGRFPCKIEMGDSRESKALIPCS
jgi:hypothetical protein